MFNSLASPVVQPEGFPGNRGNNFNLLRMIAASAVIVSHSYPLSLGRGTTEPLEGFVGFTLGTAAVKCFFAISGYFIFLSFDRRRSNLDFLLARILRILPGLGVMALLLALVAGTLFTALPVSDYLSSSETWTYPSRTITFVYFYDALPGVFANNPYPVAVNGSLWTLRFEVSCYAMLFVLGIAGLLRREAFPLFLLFYACSYLVTQRMGFTYWDSLSLPFALGMSAYVYRDRSFLSLPVVAMLIAAAIVSSTLGRAVPELWSLAIGYGSLWVGFVKLPRLDAYNRVGDYSYGTYIYAFPIQQGLAALVPHLRPLEMMMLTFPPTLLVAALSWHFVEAPAINLRKRTRSARILPVAASA